MFGMKFSNPDNSPSVSARGTPSSHNPTAVMIVFNAIRPIRPTIHQRSVEPRRPRTFARRARDHFRDTSAGSEDIDQTS